MLNQTARYQVSPVKLPSGKWSLVGSVPLHLAYARKDGVKPTEEDLAKAARFGPEVVGMCRRVWDNYDALHKDAWEFLPDARDGQARRKLPRRPHRPTNHPPGETLWHDADGN